MPKPNLSVVGEITRLFVCVPSEHVLNLISYLSDEIQRWETEDNINFVKISHLKSCFKCEEGSEVVELGYLSSDKEVTLDIVRKFCKRKRIEFKDEARSI